MIAFNRNIVFTDEPQLGAEGAAATAETILVAKSEGMQMDTVLSLKTARVPTSGREAR
jgi:hypothetical protein